MDDVYDAIMNCSVEGIVSLLDAGFDPNSIVDDQGTILHWATLTGCLGIVDLMLTRGAKVDIQNSEGETPLHIAAWKDNLGITQLLLSHKADLNAISEDGETGTPLHQARSRDVAECLLAHGADVNAQDSYGHTPLHEAAQKDSIDVAEVLIGSGADVSLRSHSGWTALHWAVWEGHSDMVDLLLSSGADVNARVTACRSTTGWTPKYWLAPEPLKAAGARHMHKGWTPLHLAAIKGDITSVRQLLNAGADDNATVEPQDTPLHWAKLMCKTEVAEALAARSTS